MAAWLQMAAHCLLELCYAGRLFQQLVAKQLPSSAAVRLSHLSHKFLSITTGQTSIENESETHEDVLKYSC